MSKKERIAKALRDAQATVKPVVDREKQGEVMTPEIMNMRFRRA